MKAYILILILFITITSGCVIKADDKTIKNNDGTEQKLQPTIKEKLDTGQELRIYQITINSDTCYVSEIVNANSIVTSGGISCIHENYTNSN